MIQIARGISARHLLLALAALACGALTALPFWVGDFLPFLDHPQHLALATVLHERAGPGTPLQAFFEPQWFEFTPYWSLYVLLDLLAFLTSMEVAGRVVVTLYVFALPWSGMAWCRAVGGRAEAGLLVSALALNTNLYLGFVNFCLAAVLGLLLLAALVVQVAERRAWRAWLLGGLSALLFFTHIHVLASCAGAAVVLALLPRSGRLRARLRAAAPVVITSLALTLPWLYLTLVAPGRRDFGTLGAMNADFIPLHRRVVRLVPSVAGAFQDRSDTLLIVLWAALVLGLMVVFGWGRQRQSGTGVVWLLAAMAMVAYLSTPFSITGQWAISIRFAFLGALLLPAVIQPRLDREAAITTLLALGLAGTTGLNALQKHRSWNREAHGLADAIAAIPPGMRLGSVIHRPSGSVMTMAPYLHAAQYYTVRRHGVATHSFAKSGPLPVALTKAGRLAAPPEWGPQEFHCEEHLRDIDYLLTRGAAPCDLPLVFREGDWQVFKVPHRAR